MPEVHTSKLSCALSLTLLAAACGGGQSQTATPAQGEGSGAAATPEPAASGASEPSGPRASGAGNPQLLASQHGEALRGLGLDPDNLPAMNKLTPEQLRKVMGLFTKSLGVECKFCHEAGNFKAPTEHKQIAARMWDEWVVGVRLKSEGGEGPMFCDSCHQGKAEFLDKSDHQALAGWMKAQFVERMHKTSGGAEVEVSCASCHGKPFDGEFLAKWGKP